MVCWVEALGTCQAHLWNSADWCTGSWVADVRWQVENHRQRGNHWEIYGTCGKPMEIYGTVWKIMGNIGKSQSETTHILDRLCQPSLIRLGLLCCWGTWRSTVIDMGNLFSSLGTFSENWGLIDSPPLGPWHYHFRRLRRRVWANLMHYIFLQIDKYKYIICVCF